MKGSATAQLTDYQAIFDSISDGVLTVNGDLIVTSFNRAAELITRVSRFEAVGRKCFEVMRAEICESACCLKRTMTSGEPCENRLVYIVTAGNKRIPIRVNTSVMRDKTGKIIGGVETFQDLSEINKLRQAFNKNHSFEDIVSKNHKMIQLFAILPQIAESRSTVLIEGPSGTGKELLARAIHNHSPWKKGPFVAVNCGALPDTLIESELFGFKAGAFTDAKQDKPGRFSLAGEGTLFLDEIGDMSPAMQVRLLRVLENRTYSPLGSTETHHVKARFIVATHRDLKQMVQEKTFREDLYFRINVIRLSLPRLAERREDIPPLVDHFIDQFNSVTGKHIMGISQDSLAAMILYDWPGNVRELENAIEHAFILCRNDLIGLEHLPEHIHPEEDAFFVPEKTTLQEIEKHAIVKALSKNGWRKMATARELGIDKNTLRRKIKKHRIREIDADGIP